MHLNDVVAECVVAQMEPVLGDASDEAYLLVGGRVVDTALQNATAVTVLRDVVALVTRCVVDEACVLRVQLL